MTNLTPQEMTALLRDRREVAALLDSWKRIRWNFFEANKISEQVTQVFRRGLPAGTHVSALVLASAVSEAQDFIRGGQPVRDYMRGVVSLDLATEDQLVRERFEALVLPLELVVSEVAA